MKTVISYISDDEEQNEKIYNHASDILRKGGLVAFPTETVYGLGADALDAEASAKIYAAKGRPSDNPLIVHIADIDALNKLSCDVNDKALRAAERFWPGPLTIILKKTDIVPDSITGGLDTVAIRMPSHPVAAKLIRSSGVYIAAPSANTSGKPSPTKASHVVHDLNGKIDMIIADDTIDIGVESTIIDLSEEVPIILRPGFITQEQLSVHDLNGKIDMIIADDTIDIGVESTIIDLSEEVPIILRPGFITQEQLSECLGEVRIDPAIMGTLERGIVPKAPGMKYKHYSPDADLVIVEGSQKNVVEKINELAADKMKAGFKVGIMASDETASLYKADFIKDMGSRHNESEAARKLYSVLRDFDEYGVKYIYSESFSTENVGQAVMNRLIKAAGHTIINLD